MNGAGIHSWRIAVGIVGLLTVTTWGNPPERWTVDHCDCTLRILCSERVIHAIPLRVPSRHSQADHYTVLTGLGTRLDLVAPLPPTPMIDELAVDVCMRSDRPGAQMSLRVVLPRNQDPSTGRLTTVLLPGPRYTVPGKWQTLRMEKLTRSFEDQVRILRSQLSYPIDSRESYVDAVVINGYCGSGETDLWLGDPRLDELLPIQRTSHPQPLPPLVPEQSPRCASVQTRGGVLEVDGAPFFARIIEEQGEEWRNFQELGFNTVRLKRPVTVHDLAAAERYGLWVIARPPAERDWPLIEDHCSRILIWDLSEDPQAMDSDHLQYLSESLQVAARQRARPFTCSAGHGTRPPTRIQVVIRPSIDSRTANAPNVRSIDATSNRPWYGTVPTSVTESVADQLPWFGVDASEILLEEEQIQRYALAAVQAGARGLLFQSTQRLDAATPSARQRSLALRQLNATLDPISPWLSGGVFELRLGEDSVQRPSIQGPFSQNLDGVVLVKHLASLALLAHGQDQLPSAPNPRLDSGYVVTVKGASSTGDVVHLAPETVRRIASRGVPGGVAVSLERPQSVDYLVFANDAGAVEELARRWTLGHAHRLDHALALASLTLDDTEKVLNEVQRQIPQQLDSRQWVEQARAEITRAHFARDQKDWGRAWNHTRQAQADTALARRHTWDFVLNGEPPQACPLTMQFSCMGHYHRWRQSHSFATAGWNVLPEGNFDSFATMRSAGWRWELEESFQGVADPPPPRTATFRIVNVCGWYTVARTPRPRRGRYPNSFHHRFHWTLVSSFASRGGFIFLLPRAVKIVAILSKYVFTIPMPAGNSPITTIPPMVGSRLRCTGPSAPSAHWS